jgi:predicted enzyme related to lactoylglutathione lyase
VEYRKRFARQDELQTEVRPLDRNPEPRIKLDAFTLDCKEPQTLASFYAALLGWEIPFQSDDYAVAAPPGIQQGAYPGITFQRNPGYQPPVWPDAPEAQQQMAHMDFAVEDLDRAVEHAVACGATLAAEQFSDGWRVMIDPAGHPFCLCAMAPIFESPHFALK